jgi:hypothetical protein
MGALELFRFEAVLVERALEFLHHRWPPVSRTSEQDTQRGEFVGVGLHKFSQGGFIERSLASIRCLRVCHSDSVIGANNGAKQHFFLQARQLARLGWGRTTEFFAAE